MRRPTPRVQNLVSQCNKGLHEFGNTGQYRKRPIIVTVDWWASFERLNLSYFPDRYKLTSAKGFIEKVSHTVTLTLRKSCHIPCFGLIELLKGFKKLRVHYLLYVLMSEETASGAVSDSRSWRLANKINAMEVKKKLCSMLFYVLCCFSSTISQMCNTSTFLSDSVLFQCIQFFHYCDKNGKYRRWSFVTIQQDMTIQVTW